MKFLPGKKGGIKDLTDDPLERQLAEIAATFIQMQEARQWADYDLMQTFDRLQVIGYVDQARVAMAKWKTIRNTPNTNVFLAALLVHNSGINITSKQKRSRWLAATPALVMIPASRAAA